MEECAAKAAKGLVGSKDVWAVLREMEDLGITPNTETYTSAVKALSKVFLQCTACLCQISQACMQGHLLTPLLSLLTRTRIHAYWLQ